MNFFKPTKAFLKTQIYYSANYAVDSQTKRFRHYEALLFLHPAYNNILLAN